LISRTELTNTQFQFVIVWLTLSGLLLCFCVIIFYFVFPDRLLSKDGVRYFNEMKMISENPFAWNPFKGTGPGYNATAKMGYSYAVGFLMWITGAKTIIAPILFNITMSLLSGLISYVITLRMTKFSNIALIAMLGTIFYPETLYWNYRILRESTAFFLLMIIILSVLKLFDTPLWRNKVCWFVIMLLAALGISLVRAQLALILPLSLGCFFATSILLSPSKLFRYIAILILISIIYNLMWPVFEQQIAKAVGKSFLSALLNISYWVNNIGILTSNLNHVLSLVARQQHGLLGYIIAPFVLCYTLFILFGIWLFVFKSSKTIKRYAISLLLIVFIYILALAINGSINIRFRANMVPILWVFAAHGFWYLICKFKLKKVVVEILHLHYLK